MDLPDFFVDSFYKNYNFFDLRYCNWQKDLFHGVLPHQQYGETAVASITPNVTGKLTLSNFSTVGSAPTTASGTATENPPAFDTVGNLLIVTGKQQKN